MCNQTGKLFFHVYPFAHRRVGRSISFRFQGGVNLEGWIFGNIWRELFHFLTRAIQVPLENTFLFVSQKTISANFVLVDLTVAFFSILQKQCARAWVRNLRVLDSFDSKGLLTKNHPEYPEFFEKMLKKWSSVSILAWKGAGWPPPPGGVGSMGRPAGFQAAGGWNFSTKSLKLNSLRTPEK